MRVLVTGAGGQVASDVVRRCSLDGDDVIALRRADLDVTDRQKVHAVVSSSRADVLLNCAAWTAVDACEGDPDRAYAHNALAVRWMAEACGQAGSHLVHLSTDYVFAGDKPEPYVEWDDPAPLNVYGASKLAGEREASQAGIGATVVRTSWVVGEHGNNVMKTILRVLDEQPSVSFVDDQRGQPTFTADLAGMLRTLAAERRAGVHHVTNQGAVSWFEFAREVAAAAGHDPARVLPISAKDLVPPRPAARPANSVLDNAVLRLAGIPMLPDFRASLPAIVLAIRGGQRG